MRQTMADGWRETADAWCCSVRSSMNMCYALIPDAEPAPYKKIPVALRASI
ncbi:MAG: hypothetical protein K1V90_07400 [Muribaculaceae bacterium]